MKKLLTLIMSIALGSSAFAGSVSYSGKAGKAVQPVAPEVGCNAFESKFALGVFGGAILPSGDRGGDALGGGVLGEYFFCPNFGVQMSYGLYATDKEHHQFDGSLVFRYPITSLCIAPYVFTGGGYSTNSVQGGDIHVGGGLEARFTSINNLGVFADGAYHFSDNGDFTIVRLGVKFPL